LCKANTKRNGMGESFLFKGPSSMMASVGERLSESVRDSIANLVD